MYNLNIIPNLISDLTPLANTYVINNDRNLYLPYFIAAEEFCASRGILIGGAAGINLLNNVNNSNDELSINKDLFVWDLYCVNPYPLAKLLCDHLSVVPNPHVNSRTTELKTKLKHREFIISIDTRLLFRIFALDNYRADISKIISAESLSMYKKIPIKVVSAEMQIIDIYRILYTPDSLKNNLWSVEMLNTECALFAKIKSNDYKVNTTEYKNNYHFTIINKLKSISNNTVLIGDYGVKLFCSQNKIEFNSSANRLQIITDININKFTMQITKILNNKSLQFSFVKFNTNISNDFRLSKYTIYLTSNNKQTALMDVFNSSEFEMIPIVMNNEIKIGNPWVLLRFIFIDIFAINLVSNIDKTNKNDNNKTNNDNINKNNIDKSSGLDLRRAQLLLHASILRNHVYSNNDILCNTFLVESYVGTFISEIAAKKQFIRDTGERFPPYFPAKNNITKIGNFDNNANNSTDNTNNSTDNSTDNSTNNSNDVNTLINKQLINSANDKNTSTIISSDLPIIISKYYAQPIDLYTDFNVKSQIIYKITHRKVTKKNVLLVLEDYRKKFTTSVQWGINKSADNVLRRNNMFWLYLSDIINSDDVINTIVDFGCGSGSELAALMTKYNIIHPIAVDIKDNRAQEYRDSEFLLLHEGVPMAMEDNSVDVLYAFYTIHHIMEDITARIADIARIVKPGGLVFIKDHNITDALSASMVDFEHFVYLLSERTESIEILMHDFPKYVPMKYYSAAQMDKLFAPYFDKVATEERPSLNYSYNTVYRKKNKYFS